MCVCVRELCVLAATRYNWAQKLHVEEGSNQQPTELEPSIQSARRIRVRGQYKYAWVIWMMINFTKKMFEFKHKMKNIDTISLKIKQNNFINTSIVQPSEKETITRKQYCCVLHNHMFVLYLQEWNTLSYIRPLSAGVEYVGEQTI